MSYTIDLFKKTSKYHGLLSALHSVSISLINKFFELRILRCAVLIDLDFVSSELDSRLHLSILNTEQIKKYMEKGFNDLSPLFIQTAIKKQDTCIAVFDDAENIVGYSWFSAIDTMSDIGHLNFSFDTSLVYTFKVYTSELYRGKRLHAHQMRLALDYFKNQGKKGIACYIYSDNFDSLKSSFRMGFKPAGFILIVKFFDRYWNFSSPACKKYSIKLTQINREINNGQ